MDDNIKEKIEAATFRRLLKHFQEKPNIQNIDLMELADFCRNCISKWYSEESSKNGVSVDYDDARELVYGMSYKDWKWNALDQGSKTFKAEDLLENLLEDLLEILLQQSLDITLCLKSL